MTKPTEKKDKKDKVDLAPNLARDHLKSEIETAKKSESKKNLKTIAEGVKNKLSEDASQIYKGLDATKSQLKDKEKVAEIGKLMAQFQKDFIGDDAKVLNDLYRKELYDGDKFKNYDVSLEKGEAKMDWETQLQFLERDLSVFIDKVFDEWSDAIAEVSHEDYENKEKSQHAFIDSILAMFEGFLPRSVLLDILKGLKDMTMFGAIFEGAYQKHAGLYVEEYFGLRKKSGSSLAGQFLGATSFAQKGYVASLTRYQSKAVANAWIKANKDISSSNKLLKDSNSNATETPELTLDEFIERQMNAYVARRMQLSRIRDPKDTSAKKIEKKNIKWTVNRLVKNWAKEAAEFDARLKNLNENGEKEMIQKLSAQPISILTAKDSEALGEF